ncbi:hypothetical protein HZ994_05405 [Akkermansiaceae bacterium]|nr:hypothetical protein HZ994_05405 [Akkermansiaceae bacterium]
MHLTDFPDRLSPMLVKELRQGLRTRSFVAVFMTLQAILAIVLLSAGAGAASDNSGQVISTIIFIFFSIAVLIIQPMRGISALSAEVKGNTIDMMVLTRLSAWRIVTGKWFAIVSQSALILVTIVPYLILRYFFGGMNLFGEIMILSLIFLSSATLTAITVGLSASGSAILRSVLPMVGLPIGAFMLLVGMVSSSLSGGGRTSFAEMVSLSTTESQVGVSLYLATCAYLAFFSLSSGTTLIASYAENHSTLRRLIALCVALVAAVLASMDFTSSDALPIIFTIILTPVFSISLTEFAPPAAPTLARFAKLGPAGKLGGFFLLPGWPSGVFFCILLTAVSAIPFILNDSGYSNDHIMNGLICLASLLFPAVLVNLFRTQGPQRVSNYVLFLLASGVVALVLAVIAESMSNEGFLWLFIWIPPILFVIEEMSHSSKDAVVVSAIAISIILFAILFVLALANFRKSVSEIEKGPESP